MSEDDDFEERREEELDKFLKEASGGINLSEENEEKEEEELKFTSREYDAFREEEKKHREKNIYEKLCELSERIISIEPSKEKKEELQRAINFAHQQLTPEGAYSFAILSGASILILAFVLLLLEIIGITFTIFVFLTALVSIYFLSEFPKSQARLFRVKASNEIMLTIIYMVIYMRSTPNLEGAIRFTAKHLKGPLSLDFKKILWDIEARNYSSVKKALIDYTDKWENNEAFVESLQIIQNSMEQGGERRKSMLDEAVETMMSGSRKKMKNYANTLQLPIMIIHALGVMLPIMVLVMFPIMILLLHETIKPYFLVIIYDILLPVIIYFTGRRTLEYRPVGFSAPDISLHDKYEPLGKMNVFGKKLEIWPISLSISAIVIILGIFLMGSYGEGSIFRQMVTSIVITFGVGLGPATYFLLDTKNKIDLRKDIKNMESEFAETLFSLGNRLSLGKPIEKAMEDTAKKDKDLEISNMFRKAVRNMKKGGLNFKNSLFDKKFGAVWDYPSKLIISVLRIITESTKKGVQVASLSAISISQYLKQVDRIEEDMKNMLSSQTTSMQFLASFLGPLVAGVSVTMAGIMISIFQGLGESLRSLQQGTGGIPGGMGMQGMLIQGWGSMGNVIPISWIQIIVGIYVVEICYLLSMLGSGIENGPGDRIARRRSAGITILIGVVIYSFSMILTWEVFGSQIQSLIGSGAF